MGPTEVGPKLLSWASDMDGLTIDQAKRTARLPIVEGHVALMPDAHFGIGATVGSVIPTNSAVIPAAVGVDIGCGMIAVETGTFADGLPDNLDKLHDWIRRVVPAGVGQGHNDRVPKMPLDLPGHLDTKLRETALRQYGSLGSGNHFVEVCLDERDRVWIVLHSGSRGIGNKLAQGHMKRAKQDMKEAMISLEDPDLAYFVQGTAEFDAYIADMLWAQEYARLNREQMMNEVLHQFFGFVSQKSGDEHRDGVETRRVNCHHNFTQREMHGGKELWITRKGAIKADTGDVGVIPGSMGTRSYIVHGLGNPLSFNSCSHGAGRRMSRGKAKELLTVESLEEAMKGKAWNSASAKSLVDEHPMAYKDIDQVMDDQADLVEVEHTLRQILNYKGT